MPFIVIGGLIDVAGIGWFIWFANAVNPPSAQPYPAWHYNRLQ